METLLNSNGKELMRMAILKHEEMFKQQVFELHRLYQTQKMLMENSRHRSRMVEERVLDSRRNEAVGKESEELEGDNGVLDSINESEIELTLGPSCYNQTQKKKMERGGSFIYSPPCVSLLLLHPQATK